MPVTQLDPDRSTDCLTIAWRLPASADAVWAHLQNVETISEWLGRPLVFDTRLGGEIIIDHADSYLCRSEVLAIGGKGADGDRVDGDRPAQERAGQDGADGDRVGGAAVEHSAELSWSFPDEPTSRIAVAVSTTDHLEGRGLDAVPEQNATAPAAESQPTAMLILRHRGLGDLIYSYATGWLAHLSYLEASLAGAPLPQSQFWPLCATFDRLVAERRS